MQTRDFLLRPALLASFGFWAFACHPAGTNSKSNREVTPSAAITSEQNPNAKTKAVVSPWLKAKGYTRKVRR